MTLKSKMQFEEYLKTLFGEIIKLHSKFELYLHLQNERVDRLNEMNLAPAFFKLTMDALISDVIISLAKIYENYRSERSNRNLNKFLRFVENNLDLFPQSIEEMKLLNCNYLVDYDLIKTHLEQIDNQKEVLDNLIQWRDKLYAHFDKKYFADREKLNVDHSINIGQIRTLIQLAGEILNKYSVAYNGVYKTIEAVNLKDVDTIFNILHRHLESFKEEHN